MKINKQHISIFFCLALFAFASVQLNAQETLEKSLETAAENNPGLKSAFTLYLAALEKVPQAGTLPDPQASFGFFIKPMELIGGNQLANFQLMQMFPWFGTLKASKDEASLMAKAKYESFRAARSVLYFQVEKSWYQLMKYDREIELATENIEMLESIEKLALVKFQSPGADASTQGMKESSNMDVLTKQGMNSSEPGMSGQEMTGSNMTGGDMSSKGMASEMNSPGEGLQDVLRVRMEILEQTNRLALLMDQRKTEEAGFNSLLNRSQDIPVEISGELVKKPLPAVKETLADSIMMNNPMLAMLESEMESYGLMEQKAKKMGMPMMGIGLNYMLIGERAGNTAMMNGTDMLMPMVSFTIPIYRKKYLAMQNEARLMKQSGELQITDLRNNLLVQYRQLTRDLDDAERRIELYGEQEELAKKTAELLLSGYAVTGNDYEEMLRMHLKVLDYGFKKIEAIVDYNTSVAMSEMLINSIKY